MTSRETYLPLNCSKLFAEGIWIFDGPVIRMDLGPFKVPFPTRMTVVRLSDGALWVHSPIAPDEDLFAAVDALGPVRHLVAPNSIHYWYMTDPRRSDREFRGGEALQSLHALHAETGGRS
ncbi:MAG: DUF4336 domain-containing protein [Novosphingobium sp.]